MWFYQVSLWFYILLIWRNNLLIRSVRDNSYNPRNVFLLKDENISLIKFQVTETLPTADFLIGETILMVSYIRLQRAFSTARWKIFYFNRPWKEETHQPLDFRPWTLKTMSLWSWKCLRAFYKLVYPQSLTSMIVFISVAFAVGISNSDNRDHKF